MPTGRVRWFDVIKGYGFIEPEDGGSDVFVHAQNVERSGLCRLVQGQTVTYDEMVDPRKGKPSAVNLRVPA
jgi:CspA family cold shock protein